MVLTTIFLAQLMGVFSLIIGVSMLMRKRMIMEIFNEVFNSRALIYAIGIAEIICGLLLVLDHNIWVGGLLPIVVTVLGWVLLLEGVFYVFASKRTVSKLAYWLRNKNIYDILSIFYVLVGIYLAYKGFGF